MISAAMFWGPGDLVRGALLLATCLLEGQGSSVKEVVKSSEGLLEIRCREEGGPRHQQMGHAEVSRIESIEKCLQKNIRMLRWRKGISVAGHIRTSYPICWAVMQAAKEVERCWFSAQGDAVGENKRDAKIFLQIRCYRGEVKL